MLISALVSLCSLFLCSQSVICPEGITSFATLVDTEYYHCVKGKDAERRTCEPGMKFDREAGACATPSNEEEDVLPKRSDKFTGTKKVRSGQLGSENVGSEVGYHERVAMGEAVKVGSLFDVRKGRLYNGFNLWNDATIYENSWNQTGGSSTTDVLTESSVRSKADHFGIGATLELDFLAGLIKIKGSAEYLKDDQTTNNVARIIMKGQSVGKTQQMDSWTALDHPDLCDMVQETSGPTHVVVEVTYGQRTYFVFDKTIDNSYRSEDVKGKLEASVTAIPGFSISGSVAIHTNGTLVSNLEKLSVKFYGDALLASFPTTYNQAIVAYDQTVRNADNETPIKYQLIPINRLCPNSGVDVTIKTITSSLVNQASNYLSELKLVQLSAKTLQQSEPAIRYQAIRLVLNTFKSELDTFVNDFKGKIAEVLPQLKAGLVEESVLVEILNMYVQSPFQKGRSDIFLALRKKEIDTITSIVAQALNNPSISLSDTASATDNECVFKGEYGTAFVLKILPSNDISRQFIDSAGTWSESDAWYTDDEEVKTIGDIRRLFEAYVEINKITGKSQCFLVKLDTKLTDEKYEVHLYEAGRQITTEFEPPRMPPLPVCSKVRYDGFELSTTQSNNAFVSGHEVIIYTLTSQGTFAESRIVAPNRDMIEITGLAPHNQYRFKTRFAVHGDQGVSNTTEIIDCITRPTSPPSILTVSRSTQDSLTLSWAKPHTIAHNFRHTVLNYVVAVSGGGTTKSPVTVTELEYEVTGLQPGVMYSISVYAQVPGEELTSDVETIQFATAPAAPAAPTRGSVEDNRATFTIGVKDVGVPDGVTKDILVVKYYKMEGDLPVAGSEIVFMQRLLTDEDAALDIASLSRGTKYGVAVKLMVKVGDKMVSSDYSAPAVITTSTNGSPVDNLQSSIDTFKSSSEEMLTDADSLKEGLEGKLVGTSDAFLLRKSGITARIDGLEENASARFTGVAQGSDAFLKSMCAISGHDFYVSGSDSLGTESNVNSLQHCLSKCADTDNCVSVTYEPNSNTCKKKAKRMGLMMWAKKNVISANLLCVATQSASIDTWNDCQQDNTNFNGADLKNSAGISNIEECLAFCRVTDGCKGVTLNTATKTCYLKNKPAGDSISSHNSAVSVSMTCMAATRGSIDRCSRVNTIFAGSQIGSTTIDTMKGCISYCSLLNSCESVSYHATSRSCRANSKRLGTSQQSSSGWSSVNMYCLGVANF